MWSRHTGHSSSERMDSLSTLPRSAPPSSMTEAGILEDKGGGQSPSFVASSQDVHTSSVRPQYTSDVRESVWLIFEHDFGDGSMYYEGCARAQTAATCVATPPVCLCTTRLQSTARS